MKAHMRTPCENCPYRKDAPRELWHVSEFEKLLKTESDQIGAVYSCHKQLDVVPTKRGFCAGWALDQRKRGIPSIALRLQLIGDPEARDAFEELSDGGHQLFASVKEMCRANGVKPRPCTREDHERIKSSAATFNESTKFLATDRDMGLALGTCKECGSTLAYPLAEWREEPTQPRGEKRT